MTLLSPYPRGRFTAVIVTMVMIALTLAGLVAVVVLQDLTISNADAHRTRDLKAVDAQLGRAIAEIQRLQELVRSMGGNPGTFTLTPKPTPRPAASASHSSYVAPRPSSAPRPTPTRHPHPRPSPWRSPSRSPSPTPPCILPTTLPKPLPCVLDAATLYVSRVAGPQVVADGSRLRHRWPSRVRLD